jgi:hypothetical protein
MLKKTLLLSAFGLLVLSGCGKTSSAPERKLSSRELLDGYSANLVMLHGAKVEKAFPARQTMEEPVSFLINFKVSDPNLLSSHIGQIDGSLFERNKAITRLWEGMFCTNMLKEIMRSRGIFIVSGALVDGDAQTHSAAMCLANSGTTTAAEEAQPTSQKNEELNFSTSQICKAGLSVMYGRDVGIMKSSVMSDYVQVRYNRPANASFVAYRCRIASGHILTWDESLNGARWYGEAADDSKLTYRISSSKLLIQDIVRGQVANQKEFSLADF